MKVLFIEEPRPSSAGQPRWELKSPQANVSTACLHSPSAEHGFHADQIALMRPLMHSLVQEQVVGEQLVWFYTPMALPLLDTLSPELVIYDCMDALDGFLNAPPELLEREADLIRQCDLVFTGGRSLYRRMEGRHGRMFCFPSSVDTKHFGRAKGHCADPQDQSEIAHPRLGYFGVIDERIDLELLSTVARQRPDWHVVMVGPVVKISEAALPRRENIHYFGQKQYAELPEYLSGWDLCLLPFARNESTRFISPTKVLEYMAAEKPIVSTPITDVAEPYGEIVYLADNAADFIRNCHLALNQSQQPHSRRADLMRSVLAETSWDQTVGEMKALIAEALVEKAAITVHPASSRAARNAAAVTPRSRVVDRQSTALAQPPVVVIGAGPTGLSAAYHLGENALLLERGEQVGGWCRSIELDGFTFDPAGHIMFSKEPYVHEMYRMLLQDNVHWQDREAWVYSHDVYT